MRSEDLTIAKQMWQLSDCQQKDDNCFDMMVVDEKKGSYESLSVVKDKN